MDRNTYSLRAEQQRSGKKKRRKQKSKRRGRVPTQDKLNRNPSAV
ncbi:MAG: hypothetical protein ACK5Q5_08625 [Planctomycetaceae bacterium]